MLFLTQYNLSLKNKSQVCINPSYPLMKAWISDFSSDNSSDFLTNENLVGAYQPTNQPTNEKVSALILNH